jgi:hypothetical protein
MTSVADVVARPQTSFTILNHSSSPCTKPMHRCRREATGPKQRLFVLSLVTVLSRRGPAMQCCCLLECLRFFLERQSIARIHLSDTCQVHETNNLRGTGLSDSASGAPGELSRYSDWLQAVRPGIGSRQRQEIFPQRSARL